MNQQNSHYNTILLTENKCSSISYREYGYTLIIILLCMLLYSPWIPRNPPFCRFVHMHRRPHMHAGAQYKTFWAAEPPFQNPRSATEAYRNNSATPIYKGYYYSEDQFTLCSFYRHIKVIPNSEPKRLESLKNR